jgi:sterol desaturase/sphingolipid hydroxylase (fatty acid hydroxylase superfamily)
MSFVLNVGVLTIVYLAVGRAERWSRLQFRDLSRPRRYFATDLAWYGVAIFATAVSVFVFRPVLSRLAIAPLRDALAGRPVAVKLLVGIVVFDLVSFLVHRALHRYDALWKFHKVHHSTLELDGFATTRTHMVENMLRFVPGQAVLFLIGMPVAVVTATVGIAAVYGVSNHSNIDVDLRFFEPVFVTPRLHRRHHVPSTTMHNYGGIFTVWDRLAGTLVARGMDADERFGVPGEVDSYPQHFRAAFRAPFAVQGSGNEAVLSHRVHREPQAGGQARP